MKIHKIFPLCRHMKILKDFVRNHARPEGCIAESYLVEECMRFCSDFLKKTTSVEEKLDRNTDYESQSILEGRPISVARSIDLSEMEKKTIHLAVIQNTAVVEPYVEYVNKSFVQFAIYNITSRLICFFPLYKYAFTASTRDKWKM